MEHHGSFNDIKTRIIDDIEKLIFLRSFLFLQHFRPSTMLCVDLDFLRGDDDEDTMDMAGDHIIEMARVKVKSEGRSEKRECEEKEKKHIKMIQICGWSVDWQQHYSTS